MTNLKEKEFSWSDLKDLELDESYKIIVESEEDQCLVYLDFILGYLKSEDEDEFYKLKVKGYTLREVINYGQLFPDLPFSDISIDLADYLEKLKTANVEEGSEKEDQIVIQYIEGLHKNLEKIYELEARNQQLVIENKDSKTKCIELQKEVNNLKKQNASLKNENKNTKSKTNNNVIDITDQLPRQKPVLRTFPPYENINKFSDYAIPLYPNSKGTGFWIPKDEEVAIPYYEHFHVYEKDGFFYTWKELEALGLVSTFILQECDPKFSSRLQGELKLKKKTFKNILITESRLPRKRKK